MALWEHFADFVALLKKRYDDPAKPNYLIGDTFFNLSLGCRTLRDALNRGNAWQYMHDDGKLRSDTGIGHVCKQHSTVTFYDVSLIPTRAFVLFSQKVDYKVAGRIWWLAIQSLKSSNGVSLQITISEFADKLRERPWNFIFKTQRTSFRNPGRWCEISMCEVWPSYRFKTQVH
jgi:Zn-dependent metalloprotease